MTEPTRVRDLTIPDADWMNGGDDANHLTTILVINGTFHHLDAIRVTEDDEGHQRASADEFADTVDAMHRIGGDGPFDTVSVNGSSYVLVLIPFQ